MPTSTCSGLEATTPSTSRRTARRTTCRQPSPQMGSGSRFARSARAEASSSWGRRVNPRTGSPTSATTRVGPPTRARSSWPPSRLGIRSTGTRRHALGRRHRHGRKRRHLTETDATQPAWSPHGAADRLLGRPGPGRTTGLWTIAADGSGKPVDVTNDRVCGLESRLVTGRPVPLLLERTRGRHEPLAHRHRRDLRPGRRGSRAADGPGPLERRHQPVQGSAVTWPMRLASLDRASIAWGSIRSRARCSARLPSSSGAPEASPSSTSLRTAQSIAFTTGGLRENLCVIRVDGTGYRQITDDPSRNRGPAWSPDGERIAFYSDRSGHYDLWTIRPDGSGLERLTATTGHGLLVPRWSPDGAQLFAGGTDTTRLFDLRRPLAEREVRALPPIADGMTFQGRSWSPDGTRLVGYGLRNRRLLWRDLRVHTPEQRLREGRRGRRRPGLAGQRRSNPLRHARGSAHPARHQVAPHESCSRREPLRRRSRRRAASRRTTAGSPTSTTPPRATSG